MESGDIVEYIDKQTILCAMVMESGNQRLRLLTEQNREVKIAAQRLSHRGRTRLAADQKRSDLVAALKLCAARRNALAATIDVPALWELVNDQQDWIDLATLCGLCFPGQDGDDHRSAVARAMFGSRRYFKFKPDRFWPLTPDQMAATVAREKQAARQARLIEAGAAWIRRVQAGTVPASDDDQAELAEILADYYLFEKESPHTDVARAIMKKCALTATQPIFDHLVAVGVWRADENVELLRHRIKAEFPAAVLQLAEARMPITQADARQTGRVDLTHLPTLTIDGQYTQDFDDALTIETHSDHFLVGIHIADVAQLIQKGDLLDIEARKRASSIYMPDQRISMAPPVLAENRLSLKKGELRPTISTMAKIDPAGGIISYDIFAATIRVDHQLSYFEANTGAEQGESIAALHAIATRFREKRLSQGAVPITLPEINVWLDEAGRPEVSRVNRESPGRMLIAEMMILANWLAARYLAANSTPAVFRVQGEPKERILKNGDGTLFQHWMQRKQLSRFALRSAPAPHVGLGLDAYVTATSPIRKYVDLITQRQIRSVLGLERPYRAEEIDAIIEKLAQPMADIGRIQFRRNRYWLLKHLESRVGHKEEAIVLQRRRNATIILLTAYMIECPLPPSNGTKLKPEDLVQVTIQRVDARRNVLSVFLG